MKRRSIVIFCSFSCLLILASFSLIKSSGAHPGSTGAPDDLTCAQSGCHQDAAVIPNAVNNNTLIFSAPDSSYFPGQVYTVTVQVQGSGINPTLKFGFEIQPIRDADSTNAGAFTLTQPARTQTLSHATPHGMKYSVTHTETGNIPVSSNFNQWVMNWTAPATNVGKITFYYATNCTNNNGQNTGDRIYLHKLQIHPNPAISIEERTSSYQLHTYYNRENDQLEINYDLSGKHHVELTVIDITGKIVFSRPEEILSGKQKVIIPMKPEIANSTYVVKLNVDKECAAKKIVVER